jgi:hypothetical protein
MKASVQYNDLAGTVSADITDDLITNLDAIANYFP